MSVAGHHLPIWFDEATGPTAGQGVFWNATTGRFEAAAVDISALDTGGLATDAALTAGLATKQDTIPPGTFVPATGGGTVAPAPGSDLVGLKVKRDTSGNKSYLQVGAGGGYGAPAAGPTLATGGAGALTGSFEYGYTETDMSGQTPISPLATYAAAAEKIKVTLPMPRRGTSKRLLYRRLGGGTWKYVGDLNSGANGYFQTEFTDNAAEVSLDTTPAPPVSDGTAKYVFEAMANGLMTFRLFDEPGSSDMAMLNADPATSGSYSIDAYGQILVRLKLGPAFQSQVTDSGNGSSHFQANWLPKANPDASAVPALTEVFRVRDLGMVDIKPAVDAGGTGALNIVAPAPGVTDAFQLQIAGDAQQRFTIGTGGTMKWGAGALVTDTTLARTAAGRLQVSNNLDVAAILNVGPGAIGSGAAVFQVTTTSTTDSVSQFGTSRGNFKITVGGAADLTTLRTNNASPLGLGTAGTTRLTIGAAGGLTLTDANDIAVGTTTGTKIGTGTTQKLGLWNATPVVQPTGIADVSGGAIIDAEMRTAFNALLAKLEAVGLLAVA
jgi:hypothetical protein